MTRTLIVALATAGAMGCDVYDINLALEAEPQLEVGDTCTGDVPVAESSHEHRHVSLDELEDDMSGLAACGHSKVLAGADGFLTLRTNAGDRWHVEAEPEDDQLDVALYFLPTCDALACRLVMDRCGPGFPEDVTFVPAAAGDYLLGIDAVEGAGEVELLVQRTQCGDGEAEHGEACDDGNLAGGDGCDPKCRLELDGPQDAEVEPNNWHTDANVIAFEEGAGRIAIPGTLGGPCDTDHYAIMVPPGGSVRVTLFDGAGLACGPTVAPVKMMFMDPAAGTARGSGTPGGLGGGCPSIEEGDAFAETLAGGEYHLTMTAPDSPPPFDYQLDIQIVPAAGP